MYGTPILGLNQARNQLWHQDSPIDIEDEAVKMDFFGHSVVAGDFNKDGADDLVIGVAGEDF
jgi:hypothetical protein